MKYAKWAPDCVVKTYEAFQSDDGKDYGADYFKHIVSPILETCITHEGMREVWDALNNLVLKNNSGSRKTLQFEAIAAELPFVINSALSVHKWTALSSSKFDSETANLSSDIRSIAGRLMGTPANVCALALIQSDVDREYVMTAWRRRDHRPEDTGHIPSPLYHMDSLYIASMLEILADLIEQHPEHWRGKNKKPGGSIDKAQRTHAIIVLSSFMYSTFGLPCHSIVTALACIFIDEDMTESMVKGIYDRNSSC